MIEPKLKPPFPYNFSFKEHDFVYCGIAKCASVSMRAALGILRSGGGLRRCSVQRVAAHGTRLTIIRHPYDRLISAWKYGWPGTQWEPWIKHVLHNPAWDVHTLPYHDLQAAWCNHILPLEMLGGVWVAWKRLNAEWLPDVLPHQNPAKFGVTGELPYRDEIEQVYADDLLVWEDSCARFAVPAGELQRG